MTPTAMDRAVQALYERIHRQSQSANVPLHVVRRLAYSLAGEDIEFLDVLVHEDQMQTSGRVLVYTAKVFAIAEMQGVYDTSNSNGGSVALTIRPRATLNRIDVSAIETPELNTVAAWQPQSDTSRATDGWPRGTAVSLTYEGLDAPVILPLGHPAYREDFEAFMPSLLNDLTS